MSNSTQIGVAKRSLQFFFGLFQKSSLNFNQVCLKVHQVARNNISSDLRNFHNNCKSNTEQMTKQCCFLLYSMATSLYFELKGKKKIFQLLDAPVQYKGPSLVIVRNRRESRNEFADTYQASPQECERLILTRDSWPPS